MPTTKISEYSDLVRIEFSTFLATSNLNMVQRHECEMFLIRSMGNASAKLLDESIDKLNSALKEG